VTPLQSRSRLPKSSRPASPYTSQLGQDPPSHKHRRRVAPTAPRSVNLSRPTVIMCPAMSMKSHNLSSGITDLRPSLSIVSIGAVRNVPYTARESHAVANWPKVTSPSNCMSTMEYGISRTAAPPKLTCCRSMRSFWKLRMLLEMSTLGRTKANRISSIALCRTGHLIANPRLCRRKFKRTSQLRLQWSPSLPHRRGPELQRSRKRSRSRNTTQLCRYRIHPPPAPLGPWQKSP
jgi:hypothetical protein